MSEPSLPPELELAQDQRHTVLVYRWFTWGQALQLPLGLVFLLAGGLGLALLEGELDGGSLLPLLLFFAMGLGLVWWGLAGVLNRSTIALSSEWVEVSTGPVPWHLPRRVPLSQVRTFSASRQIARRNKRNRGLATFVQSGPSQAELSADRSMPWSRFVITWSVVAVHADATETKLISRLPSRQTALSVRRILEDHLNRARSRA